MTKYESVWKECTIFTINGELHFCMTFLSAIAYLSIFFAAKKKKKEK